MSNGFIGFGITINPETLNAIEIETVESLVTAHQDELFAKLGEIDPAGLAENLSDAYGYEDGDAGIRKALVEAVITGVAWLQENWEYQGVFTVPGGKGYVLIAGGGVTWGDSPFDEYDSVILAGNAATALPELGKTLGVIGGGIQA